MNQLEKMVWAAAYALCFQREQDCVSRQMSAGKFTPSVGFVDAFTEQVVSELADIVYGDATVDAATTAVEWADQAVFYLREHKKHGQFHVNDDLELERQEEES